MVDDALDADVTAEVDVSNISDEQVDKYFESGGKEIPAEAVKESAPAGVTQEAKPAEPAQQEQPQKDRFVPHEALHEERMKRKELAEQVKVANERSARLEQTFQKIMQGAQAANEPKAPSFDEDPIEALRQNQIRLEKRLADNDQYLGAKAQQEEQARRYGEFEQQCKQKVAEFSQANPDYLDAYRFAQKARFDDLKALGYGDKDAMALLNEDEAAIAAKSFAEGVNPAERIYKYAQMRGYAKAQPEAKAPDVKQAEDKIAKLEKGMQESKSLNQISGKTPASANEVSLEALSHMDDDELADYVSGKNWEKIARQLR